MPELPEVETVMRGLSPFLTGATIHHVDQRRADLRIPFPDNMPDILAGQKILHLSRRAKYLLIHFERDLILAVHLGMSGAMTIISGADYTPQKHDHVIFDIRTASHDPIKIIYNDPRRFGMMFFVDASANIASHPAFHHLGPEPLGNGFSADYLHAALMNKKTSIKQALLDQRIVVGVGNIYACEALYKAKISPMTAAHRLSKKRLSELVHTIQDTLRTAIDAGGSSLKDFKQADGTLGYFQHQFAVYGREGEICPHPACIQTQKPCIKRKIQAGRSTFYCSRTQK